MAKCLGSCRELKKIKIIRAKESDKYKYYSSNISIREYDYYLSSDSGWY